MVLRLWQFLGVFMNQRDCCDFLCSDSAGNPLAHLAVVDGFDQVERLMIPADGNGTRYKMEKEEFLNYWNIRGV